ncbi:MAG: Na/Pi symporter, partial [Cyclobacteriaceae bacterium]|nr:Na/Pi symporter [Cyclobacteriaceae bacterium]
MENINGGKVQFFNITKRVLILMTILFVFLVSLNLMSGGFKLLGKDIAEQIITITSNPFVGLFVGLLATALVQSSSTTTSMIVAIVASGALTLQNAIPMIMGANIGTSVTSTIVALGHIPKKTEFQKAISSATVHDFFNLIVVAVLFPIEYFTGALSSMGAWIAHIFYSESVNSTKVFSLLGVTVKPVAKAIISVLGANAAIVIPFSIGALFISLKAFSVSLRKILIGKSQENLEKYVFGNPIKSLLWGAGITASVQSSSVTTSLIVPLVATDKISLRKAFPFLMGANIGTTVTALIAAISQTEAALAVAICHLLFNLFGVLFLFPIESIRNIPIWMSETLGLYAGKRRLIGVAYIIITFFLIPFALIYSTSDFSMKKTNDIEVIESQVMPVSVIS